MPKMRTSFDGLVKLLAKHLYPEPNVFIRELIQNAHDSIQLRRVEEPEIGGEIDVIADPSARTITFTDNGMGMDQADVEEFLATIGSTGTGVRTAELAQQNITVDTIGQFGIGLLSAFVVAERIDLFTRKRGGQPGWHWVNHGGEDYELSQDDDAPSPGTRVVVTVGADHVDVIEEDSVRETIKRYADFLPFRIMLNGNGPVNVIDAPWHRAAWASEDDYQQALRLFLNERYPDVPLHAIPVDLESPKAKGALYISDQHIPGINTFGVVDIFQERMCVRLSDQELLPDWAKFVRGVVDSPALQPTASRDNLIKDAAYFALRKALGDLIVQSLIRLAETDRKKFHRLCDWHHFHLKGMAVHHQGFFDAVIDHLPFETNEGNLSLKEYLGRQRMEPGKRVPVYFFSYGYDSTQFYELANAKGLLAINTGRNFDETLVRRYVERRSDTLELSQLDHLDDPDLYERLPEEERRHFVPLENAMRHALEWGGNSRVRPSTRRFAPESMSGLLIQTQKIEAYEKMEALLSQPFMMEGLGELAEEVKVQMGQTPLDLFINADNPLIQELSRLEELDHPRYRLARIGHAQPGSGTCPPPRGRGVFRVGPGRSGGRGRALGDEVVHGDAGRQTGPDARDARRGVGRDETTIVEQRWCTDACKSQGAARAGRHGDVGCDCASVWR
jgi:molecular chaperone HtpG